MTRSEAAIKVAKLRRTARGTTNPAEANTARTIADKLETEHHLTDNDLTDGQMGAAFDDLLDQLQQVIKQRASIMTGGLLNTNSMIQDTVNQMKQTSDSQKAAQLRKVVMVSRALSFCGRHIPTVAEFCSKIETSLKNHEITL